MAFYELDLEALRSLGNTASARHPFEHQREAFEKLSAAYDFDAPQGTGGLLVLPTGAGKTFTTVKWIADNVLTRNCKVLWLAHSCYLLDQACKEFREFAPHIPEPRKRVNLRVISSAPSHNSAADIRTTDDVVIITTQTAIRNLHTDSTDKTGTPWQTQLKRFVEGCAESGLFIVLDEAHHAPAYGCRNLLVGHDPEKPGIRTMLTGANLLGLTATPTHSDPGLRGWLSHIFERGVIYEAPQPDLTAQRILARPNYIPHPTGREYTVEDAVYTRLMREHRDLPEEIIHKLATDGPRNDAIVDAYVENREAYGKTIIFADRWFQCVYLKEKLLERGVRADAIYSHIDADPGSAEARNQRKSTENARILAEFRQGRDASGRERLEVLINVRMLTEGTDVPMVRTVFLTRQTTSQILLRQMIGRALRGPLAGGEEEANVVMFMDEWRRMIDWASPADLVGGTSEDRLVRGYRPLEFIAIRLVEELSRHLDNPDIPLPPFERLVPTGWYETQTVVADPETEEMQAFTEYVIAYECTQPKFEALIDLLLADPLDAWSNERLDNEWIEREAGELVSRFFDRIEDDIGGRLLLDVARIARHVAQRLTRPEFVSFDERDKHDLDDLARRVIPMDRRESDLFLRKVFEEPGLLWKRFFRSYERFSSAVDAACRRLLHEECHGPTEASAGGPDRVDRGCVGEPSEEIKKQVLRRDNRTCLCCGARGRGVRLQIDHIFPRAMGGDNSLDNLQTLCSLCNRHKGTSEINFLSQTGTQLNGPKKLELLGPERNPERALRRTVNLFYHCRAVSELRMHVRKNGWYYRTWEIELFAGNDPRWLERHSNELLRYIREDLGHSHVKNIVIVGPR